MKSHKWGGPGLACEIGLHLWKSEMIWLKGPLEPGNSDLSICQSELKHKIPDGKKAVCDGGCRDKKDPKLALPNSHDSDELRTFKAHARVTRAFSFSCQKTQLPQQGFPP